MSIEAIIFDLDGVITDTAEYHFRSWKRLADEEGIPFTRTDNEALRGVSRRESLLRMLKGKVLPESRLQELMTRKNEYYRAFLQEVTPNDLLPGVAALLDKLDAAGIRYALASASHNARDVVARLGILERLAVLGDGGSVARAKPAPDLFRFVAAKLGLRPDQCLVVEDAEAGIEAAHNAGMPSLALGPAERFGNLLLQPHTARRDDLQNLELDELRKIADEDATWTVSQAQFDVAKMGQMETVFTLGNGYFCTRGSFEEGYPGDLALTFAHGVFDDMPLIFTELANLPNWLDLDIRVDGARFRLDQGHVLYFRRMLDVRHGILRRIVRWQSPGGVILDITFERFASYKCEHLGALRVVITAVNRACQLDIGTGINGHVSNSDLLHWHHEDQGETEGAFWLRSHTRHSGITLGAAARVAVPGGVAHAVQQCPGHPRALIQTSLEAAGTFQIDKIASYATSRDVASADEVVAHALAALPKVDYDVLRLEQTLAWREVWEQSDVIIEGDNEAQRAIRFNLFQLLVAAAQRDERVSMAAKSMSGLGYRGHVFWDTEIFILPFFIYTQPHLARNMLMYRYHTLPGARRKAAKNGYLGAQYAWESAATGDEVTPKWLPGPDNENLIRIWTGDIEIHISTDVAYAVLQYWRVTGDDDFLRDYGAEIILDTARFWASRAEREEANGTYQYAVRDVIGPDEYHDHVDNSAYTNRMAQWHLRSAMHVLDWLKAHAPQKASALIAQLHLDQEALAHWQDVIDHIILNHDPDTGLITQFDNFFGLKQVDWAKYANVGRSLQAVLGIEGANEHQVIKQADVIMLLCLLREEYDLQTMQKNWDTYMPITDHRYGSSLGPSFHAWAACELNRPDEAYEHFMLAARADLEDVRGNAADGIHAASAGGLWQAIAFGFAGLGADGLTTTPRLPAHWQRLAFKYRYRGVVRQIDIRR